MSRLSSHEMTIGLIVLGSVAAALAVWGAADEPEAFQHNWLTAALFWLALPAGAMPIVVTHALTGGEWGRYAVPVARVVIATLPVPLAAFAVPLLFGLPTLFEWTQPVDQLPDVVRHKTFYLNVPFFVARSLIVFAVLLLMAVLLGAWRDRPPGAAAAAVCGVLWVFATSALSVDWLMSLAPRWYSDVFGLLLAAGWIVAAIALVILLAARFEGDGEAARGRRFDVANLWLAAVLIWVFLAFSQYLIIWMGNLPHEIEWYIHRGQGTWRAVSVAILMTTAVIPFIAMLSGGVRRSRRALGWLAAVVLIGHALQTYWLVMPTFHHEGVELHWLLPVTWAAVGAPWGLALLRARRRLVRAGETVPQAEERAHV